MKSGVMLREKNEGCVHVVWRPKLRRCGERAEWELGGVGACGRHTPNVRRFVGELARRTEADPELAAEVARLLEAAERRGGFEMFWPVKGAELAKVMKAKP